MKFLHLTLHAKWFDLYADGIKKEDYREITPYWERRLSVWDGDEFLYHKSFDLVILKNGYAPDARALIAEFKGISQGYGVEAWGAVDRKKYYRVRVGKIVPLPYWSEVERELILTYLLGKKDNGKKR